MASVARFRPSECISSIFPSLALAFARYVPHQNFGILALWHSRIPVNLRIFLGRFYSYLFNVVRVQQFRKSSTGSCDWVQSPCSFLLLSHPPTYSPVVLEKWTRALIRSTTLFLPAVKPDRSWKSPRCCCCSGGGDYFLRSWKLCVFENKNRIYSLTCGVYIVKMNCCFCCGFFTQVHSKMYVLETWTELLEVVFSTEDRNKGWDLNLESEIWRLR